jgi:hypothetical protein
MQTFTTPELVVRAAITPDGDQRLDLVSLTKPLSG